MLRDKLRAVNSLNLAVICAFVVLFPVESVALDITIVESGPNAEVGLWV
jgi:hypothetical protein